MTVPVLQFVSNEWVRLSGNPTHVTVELHAVPPVGAALKATVYSKLMNSGTAQWGEVGTSVIDNLAYTAATPSMTFVVNTGNYYAIKLQGEAHLLMPGDEIEVKVQLLVNGVPIAACPQPDPAKGNVAGLVGMLYLQVGD